MVTVGRWSALPYTADPASTPATPRAATVPIKIRVLSFMVSSPPSVEAVAVVEVVVVVWAVVVRRAGEVAQAHAVTGVAVVEPVRVEDLLAVHALDVQRAGAVVGVVSGVAVQDVVSGDALQRGQADPAGVAEVAVEDADVRVVVDGVVVEDTDLVPTVLARRFGLGGGTPIDVVIDDDLGSSAIPVPVAPVVRAGRARVDSQQRPADKRQRGGEHHDAPANHTIDHGFPSSRR